MTVSNHPTSAAYRSIGGHRTPFWAALGVSLLAHLLILFAVRLSGPPDVAPARVGHAASRLTAALATSPGGGSVSSVPAAAQASAAATPPESRNTDRPDMSPPVIAVAQGTPVAVPVPDIAPAPPRFAESPPEAAPVRELDGAAAGAGGMRAAESAAGGTSAVVAVQASVEASGMADPSLLAAYRQALVQAALGYKRYPPLARERGWEGTVELIVVLLPRHPAPVLRVTRGSGFALLDEQALEMMSRAARRLPVPEALRSMRAEFAVPIRFELGD